jgi:predicted nucleic acid-binding protein
MQAATTVTVQTRVPAKLHQEIEQLVDIGWYNDTNDVLLEALRRFLSTHRADVMERHLRQILPSLQIVAQAFELDPGEITALAVMQSERTAILLTDDSAARLAAESFGFAVHGAIACCGRSIASNDLALRF